MKKCLALLCAGVSLSVFTMSAAAVSFEPVFPLDRVAAGTLTLKTAQDMHISVEVIEHTPERDDIVLYDEDFDAQTADSYQCELESGDYTIAVTAPQFQDGFGSRTLRYDFTIENPDFSEDLEYMEYTITISDELIADEDEPVYSASEPVSVNSDGILSVTQQMQFSRYDRIFGDYDKDGLITIDDAQNALTYYTYSMFAQTPEWLPAEFCACDITQDGILDLSDATLILTYYTMDSLGLEQSWESLT